MRKSIKKFTALLATGVLVFGALGCGSSKENQKEVKEETKKIENVSDTEELKTLRIGAAGQDGNYTMELGNLAYDSGILQEELKKVGYEVEIVPFTTGGPEINEALASGVIDAAIVGDFPVFTVNSNGIDTTIVAVTNQANQYGIVATKGIDSAKDLEGKKVIVPAGTVAQYYWEHYVDANGLDASSIETINAASDATSLLQTGDADAYAITGYIAAYFEQIGLGHVLKNEAEVDGSTTFAFEVKSDVLTDDLGVAINKALIRSYEKAVENPEELYASLESESVPKAAWEKSYSFDPTLSFLSPEITPELKEYYNNLNDWLNEKGIITSKVDVDKLVNDTYYAKAKAELEAK